MPRRELFPFDRMRREMDELFGDLWERSSYSPRRQPGFSPRVDVYYADGPPRAVIKAEIAGVDLSGISIETNGRQLIIFGERPVQETEGRLYQQIEIASGRFRRVIELSADVVADQARATYEDGILRVELPLRTGPEHVRRVPVERPPE